MPLPSSLASPLSLLLLPVVAGSLFSVFATVVATIWFRRAMPPPQPDFHPPLTVLKPLFGLDKKLRENIASLLEQDYPDYQVVLAIQRPGDPAIPVARALAAQYPARVTLCIADAPPRRNGKVENLMAAYALAKHDILVISDSDVRVERDYLKTVVAPLADVAVGASCTLYRAAEAGNLCERFELLSMNVDFLPLLVVALRFGIAKVCLGASTAIRRATLERIGGFEELAAYMAEDAEMGRRIHRLGLKTIVLPRFVETMIDLPDWRAWWEHQAYWDQNARYVNYPGYLALFLLKAVAFAALYAALRGFDSFGLEVLAAAVAVRMACAVLFLQSCVQDGASLRNIALLPLRDLISVLPWLGAFFSRSFTRRGKKYRVSSDGRILS